MEFVVSIVWAIVVLFLGMRFCACLENVFKNLFMKSVNDMTASLGQTNVLDAIMEKATQPFKK